MTHNHPANGSFHTPADIAVDNPPRDPQAVVKRRPGPKCEDTPDPKKQKNREYMRRWRAANRAKIAAYNKDWRADNVEFARAAVRDSRRRASDGWQRLKRIAAARGMTAEALLDEMERR